MRIQKHISSHARPHTICFPSPFLRKLLEGALQQNKSVDRRKIRQQGTQSTGLSSGEGRGESQDTGCAVGPGGSPSRRSWGGARREASESQWAGSGTTGGCGPCLQSPLFSLSTVAECPYPGLSGSPAQPVNAFSPQQKKSHVPKT